MFMALTSDLQAGGKINLTLAFEKSGAVTFELPIKSDKTPSLITRCSSLIDKFF
jgi:copper(I)-binding protein